MDQAVTSVSGFYRLFPWSPKNYLKTAESEYVVLYGIGEVWQHDRALQRDHRGVADTEGFNNRATASNTLRPSWHPKSSHAGIQAVGIARLGSTWT